MTLRIQFLSFIFSLGTVAIVFELIRKRRIMEKYSLLWFGSAIVLLILTLWKDLLEKFATFLGIYYAPSALFAIAAFCGMTMILHITVVISRLTEQNKTLAQEIGLLRHKLQLLEQNGQSMLNESLDSCTQKA